jgi:hypothetical protein
VGNPAATLEMNEVRAAARTLGLEVITLEIRRGEDIAPAFDASWDNRVIGVSPFYVQPEPPRRSLAAGKAGDICSF